MNALEGPDPGLVELHQLFQKLRLTVAPIPRRQLAFEIVLHPAAMKRLRIAVTRFRKRFIGRRSCEFDEVLQETLLRLVGWLSSESLRYEDRGVERFAGWYWTLCRNASLQALQKYRRKVFEPLDEVEEDDLPPIPEPTLVERRWDEVLLEISRIRHPLMKAVMIDMAAGVRERQTARTYQIAESTVSRLRKRGLALVRRCCREEAVGQG